MKNRLKMARGEFEITQKELAAGVGVSNNTINAIENGDYNPSLLLALKISTLFKKPIEELFRLDEEELETIKQIKKPDWN